MKHAILRTAALELQATSNDDIVKVAGIFARIKNWWRAFQSPQYKERVQQLREDSAKIKYLLNILGENINAMESAIADSDVPMYERSIGVVKDYSMQLAKELGSLGQEANAVQDAVPEETKEVEENSPEAEWVTEGYTKDQSIMAQLRKQLPAGFDVPIGKVGQPLQNFNWFRQFAPDNIRVSPSVEKRIVADVTTVVSRYIPLEKAIDLVNKNSRGLIDNLKIAMLNNSFIYNYRDPRITEEIKHRPVNQMEMKMAAYNVSLPETDLLFDFKTIGVVDMMASTRPAKALVVNMIKNISFNPLSGKISPTKDEMKQTSPVTSPIAPEESKTASRRSILLKIAEGTEVPRKSTPISPQDLKTVLMKLDPTFSPQAADLFVKHVQFENGADLHSIYNYNIGNITASSKYSGSFWRPPWFAEPGPNASKRDIYLHDKMLKGNAPRAFRAHNSMEEGVADYLKMLKVSFPSVDASLRNADAASMAKDLVSSNYCPDCNPKTLAKHFGVQGVSDDSSGWQGLGEGNQMAELSLDQQQGALQEYDALMQELTAMGPIQKMVRLAVLKNKLPTTKVLIALDGSFPTQVRFANVLSSVLRNEIDADVSIHASANKVELECDVIGSAGAVEQAVVALAEGVGAGFKGASSRHYVGLSSTYDALSAVVSDENYRKFALSVMV